MSEFWRLLEKSTIGTITLAVMLVGTVCYLAISGRPIPEYLGAALVALISFFFGQKAQQYVESAKAAAAAAAQGEDALE